MLVPANASPAKDGVATKRAVAAAERKRELALRLARREQGQSEKMALLLNAAPLVQQRRQRFAIRVLLAQAFYLVFIMAGIIATTISAPDFDSLAIARFKTTLSDRVSDSVQNVRACVRVEGCRGVCCGLCHPDVPCLDTLSVSEVLMAPRLAVL